MPRNSAPTRAGIINAAYKLFRRRGYTRVSMDEIALRAGVTKKALYYHYTSKDQLLATVLETQHALALAAFKSFGDKLVGSPEAIVDRLFQDLAAWADTPRWAGSGFTRLVIELADQRGHPARTIARQHKAMLEEHLAALFARRRTRGEGARARDLAAVRGRHLADARAWRPALRRGRSGGRQAPAGRVAAGPTPPARW